MKPEPIRKDPIKTSQINAADRASTRLLVIKQELVDVARLLTNAQLLGDAGRINDLANHVGSVGSSLDTAARVAFVAARRGEQP